LRFQNVLAFFLIQLTEKGEMTTENVKSEVDILQVINLQELIDF
jgi:hypothetical protein